MEDAPQTVPVHIDETISSIAKLRAEHRENATPLQRFVDRMVKLLGRPQFIGVISVVIVAWIGLNVLFASLGHHMIDSSPFPWMGEAISLTSLYRVVLVLISQKREDQLAHHREMLILELAILSDIHDRLDPEAETMGQAADTQSVLNAVTKKPASRPQN